jgi:hypothetical protein
MVMSDPTLNDRGSNEYNEMSDWKQTIEAQIAEMHYSRQTLKEEIGDGADTWADTMQALLDVAVAADALDYLNQTPRIREALDKLREVGDE